MFSTTTVQRLRPRERDYFETDSDGLKLKVLTSGRKIWYVRIQSGGRDIHKKIGEFPAMSLATARRVRDELKAADRAGVNIQAKKMTFGRVAQLWFDVFKVGKSPRYAQNTWRALSDQILPILGRYPLEDLERVAILSYLQSVAQAKSANRARQFALIVSQVMNFALDQGLIKTHPAQRLARALPKHHGAHLPSATDELHLARVLAAVNAVKSPTLRACLHTLAYCFPRVGELHAARWAEIDLDSALWKIPAARTKLRREHLVPLPRQIVCELCALKDYLRPMYRYADVDTGFVFPSRQSCLTTAALR